MTETKSNSAAPSKCASHSDQQKIGRAHTDYMLQCGAENAKLDPKLGCPARLRMVIFRRIEISKAVLQRHRPSGEASAPQCRRPRSRRETSAESWPGQSAGIHQQDAERSDAEGVQSSAVAKEQPR